MLASWSWSAHARMHGSTSSCGSPATSSLQRCARARVARRAASAALSCSQRTVRANASPPCSTSTSCRTLREQLGVARRARRRAGASMGGRRCDMSRRPSVPHRSVRGPAYRPAGRATRAASPATAAVDPRGRDRARSRARAARAAPAAAVRAARRPRRRRRRARRSPCAAARASSATGSASTRWTPAAAPSIARAGHRARERGDQQRAALGVRAPDARAGGGRARRDAIRSASASWSSAGEPASAASFSPRERGRRAPAARAIQPSRSAGASVLDAVPDVGDARGVEPLQRGERPAVVAELGVVVVLDHEPVARARPREQRVAPLRRPSPRRSGTGGWA